jgi:hypothetical protein
MLAAVTVYVSLSAAQTLGTGKDPGEFFEARVRPVLAKNCFACHTNSKMGGLQLDSRDNLLKGGSDGPVVIPGNPDQSVLIQAIRQTHERFKMPPGNKLKQEEIDDLAAWVKSGANWPAEPAVIVPAVKGDEYHIRPDQLAFWSFQPVRKPAVPQVNDAKWPQNDIDRFILAKLEQKGLKPVRAADKRVLIRRVTFDLTGLPPTPEEVDAFVNDNSPGAFAKVVDRLLASPHYGERWARHWLDYARYADEKFTRMEASMPNMYRYRDWVIQAFNNDMPYDLFVKAQIAADLLSVSDRAKLLPGLGFYALTSSEQDDRVDVTTRTFLGLTVACARCHDHKYDPIPTKDFYSLEGIFKSTEYYEIPLASKDIVDAYQKIKTEIKQQKSDIDVFVQKQSKDLAGMLAAKTSRYLVAAWKVMAGSVSDPDAAAQQDKLDQEILKRWIDYLKDPAKEHPFLKNWYATVERRGSSEEVQKAADEFQEMALSVFVEQQQIDDRNYVKLGGAEGLKSEEKRQFTNVESLEIKKYYLWRDLASEPYTKDAVKFDGGVYYFGPKEIDRWLSGEWKEHLDLMRTRLAGLEASLPVQYPFLHAIRDVERPANVRIQIRGEETNLGDEAPRRFLRILCKGEPEVFTKGSGRLELAESIVNSNNPLTARVIVNRIWEMDFGQGIVRSSSNFGQLGDRPSNPDLLNYLAASFVENHWSIKALQRQILLSATYQLSTDQVEPNVTVEPDNRLFWRANMKQRLEIEALRDGILAVSGNLDLNIGGPAGKLTNDFKRRTLYGLVSRNKLDPTLELFDFPNPNNTTERRSVTVGPLQRLYFMNSSFIAEQSKAFAKRLSAEASSDEARIVLAYRLLYGRRPEASEIELGLNYLQQTNEAWPRYAQALLSSSEFSTVN